MADIGQTGMSGEQSQRFATVNDDEFNRILTEKKHDYVWFNVI